MAGVLKKGLCILIRIFAGCYNNTGIVSNSFDMRKLLIVTNAMLRDQKLWQQN